MPHYYSKQQTSDLNLEKINIKLGNLTFPMYTGSGVFSKKRLDKGTELLIRNTRIKNGISVLDLGCGIGIVGIYIKKTFPDSEVFMSDINKRAVFLARKNAKLHEIDANIVQSNSFDKIKELFDAILLNPPQVAGRDTCFQMIEDSFKHLKEGGSLELVARHNKGGKVMSEKMKEVFGNVEDTAKGSGYRVYFSQKKT